MAIPRKDSSFFHAHCHSQFSTIDALGKIPQIVQKAHDHEDPALALTDHGSMGGFVQLYKECMARGMKPYPGFEGYLIDPTREDWETPEKKNPVGRYHFGLLALNEAGYIALVRFMSMTHTRPRFNRFARCTLNDLLTLGKEHGDNLVLTTGCYFGLIQQSIAHGDDALADRYVKLFKKHFTHTFVELQHHNICHDDQPEDDTLVELDDADIVQKLVEIAERNGLPVIATQDSHYVDHKHKPAHSLMKRMVYASTEDGFPGDSFHLASAEWVADHYTQEVWDLVEEGFDELLDLWDCHIGPLDNYVIDVPQIRENAAEYVRELTEARLEEYLDENPDLDPQPYWDRHDHEDDVVTQLGMHDYHLVVQDYVQASDDKEVMVEARGSANGSLDTFLMGITQADPVYWGGMFERYLSPDRTKPPDIDLDVEDEERQWLLSYIIEKYDAVQVGTYSKLGTTVDPETGEERGSVMQSYLMYLRRLAEEEAKRWFIRKFEIEQGMSLDEYLDTGGKLKPYKQDDLKRQAGVIYSKRYGSITGLEDVRERFPKDYKGLKVLADLNSAYKSYGVHAGAVLLPGQKYNWRDYIPTMLVASSGSIVTQYMGDDVEAFGLLKMDILGQSSLRVMKLCQQNIIDAGHVFEGKNVRDFTWIPLDDPDACKLLREGRTDTGIFHYEGYTKAKGGRELKIQSTEDAVMGQALFMPGAMDSGQKDLYIKRRNSAAERKKITYISPEFEKALNYTYGAVIYQEQVIEIMRNLGMDMAGINKFFKVVKDSGKGAVERNRERMAEVRQQFGELCRKRGIADVDAAWAQTAGFVSYGFNRAHASGYGIRSYRTAYLKAHYPVEYMAALLEAWAGKKKEIKYVKEARRIGIKLLPPDVNVSGAVWTQDFERNNVIRKGLSSIPGIGLATAEELAKNAPYDSVEDLIERTGRAVTGGKDWLATKTLKGTLSALNDVGALDSLLGE